jgi:hypothetical protein
MHVRTVQSFRVNTLHAVVSFHSASKYLVPESPQPEREGSGRIYILATCPQSGSATSSVPDEPLRRPSHQDTIVSIPPRRD